MVGCVAWLALLLSLAALVLAWAAFRHSGARLDGLLDDRGAALDGMIGLGAARDALGRGERAARWRSALAFADAGAAARSRWQTLDGDLDRLDRQLREGSSEALATLDGVVERIRHVLGGGAGGRR